jgi:soluble lytic murein transglycosylase-like protein
LGSRLRDAIELIESRPQDASAALEELLPVAAPIEDAVFYYLGLANADTHPDRSREYYGKVLEQHGSTIAPRAALAMGELLLASNDLTQVAALAESDTDWSAQSPSAAAALSLLAGRALVEQDPIRAAGFLSRARKTAPGGTAAREAAVLLETLRAQRPELEPDSARDLLEEAGLLEKEARPAACVAVLDRFLARHADDPRRIDALVARAAALARLSGKQPAAEWLDAQLATTSNRLDRARILFASATYDWNAHRAEEALKKFQEMLSLKAGSRDEQRAWYAVGRIHESERRFTSAASAYRNAARGSDAEVARESRWRAGWVSYLAGNFAGAAQVFKGIATTAEQQGNKAAAEEAAYWQARSLERDGRDGEAETAYRQLLKRHPDGYYAYLVEARRGITAAPIEPMPAVSRAEGIPAKTQMALTRARLFREAGIEDLVHAEVKRGLSGLGPNALRAALPTVAESGSYAEALRAALRLYEAGLLQEVELYPYLYPRAYEELVVAEAHSRGIDPLLVLSLIRQESLFDHRATSPAAAYGLMQLLLSTAERMAPKAGLDTVNLDDLFEPTTNVRLGVTYLAELSERFAANTVLVLASYNAGETAAERWSEQHGKLEIDEFVEQISYRETRNYVKKVLRNYRNYKRLYGDTLGATTTQGL